ncbi:PEPxxWA-CTERM sorting domain-containing protein [Sphingobium subterraneum]|uniref:Ice-binding protein C-terminal domain-containing protein n=1 Tax=Sphingobium subterraneum TaxID=627688 RepID=A0A841J294_9SPHN|nr:hypothetical protein [Sphingobium subterraneum]
MATSENVLINANSTPSLFATGQTETSNVSVLFTSLTDLVVAPSNGQSRIRGAFGSPLNNINFNLLGGATFKTAEFNLFPQPGNQALEATSVLISYFNPLLNIWGTHSINTNGQNFLGIYGDAGEIFTGISITTNPIFTGFEDLRQVRLGGISTAAVPEPTTWAMMLAGFGAMGVAMRRRRKVAVSFA